MKKLMVLLVSVMFTASVMAQTEKSAPAPVKAAPAKAQMKQSQMPETCFMMMNGKLMKCSGDKKMVQATDVALANGTKVSAKGEVTTKEGKKSMLAAGQCIDMKGMTMECDKMPGMMDKKMDNK